MTRISSANRAADRLESLHPISSKSLASRRAIFEAISLIRYFSQPSFSASLPNHSSVDPIRRYFSALNFSIASQLTSQNGCSNQGGIRTSKLSSFFNAQPPNAMRQVYNYLLNGR